MDKKWMWEKLIPNLESKSVIVVDNASYHNVQLNRHPTSNARKGEMLFWLDKHDDIQGVGPIVSDSK